MDVPTFYAIYVKLGYDGRAAKAQCEKIADFVRNAIPELSELRETIRVALDGAEAKNTQARFPPEKLALLRHGLQLDGQALKPAKVSWQNEEQLRIVLREGKKRQIRRMCEQVGLKVVGLKRIRIGSVLLGQLPAGQWRYLGEHERF